MKIFLSRMIDMLRLMVGAGNYKNYVEHMEQQHPGAPVMSETEYFRHGQNARYPGKDGAINRCPC